jgi:hypothetical protein
MKLTIILASVCCALLLGGCADQSLLTDDEYYKTKGPAPNSPDPMAHILNANNAPGGY